MATLPLRRVYVTLSAPAAPSRVSRRLPGPNLQGSAVGIINRNGYKGAIRHALLAEGFWHQRGPSRRSPRATDGFLTSVLERGSGDPMPSRVRDRNESRRRTSVGRIADGYRLKESVRNVFGPATWTDMVPLKGPAVALYPE